MRPHEACEGEAHPEVAQLSRVEDVRVVNDDPGGGRRHASRAAAPKLSVVRGAGGGVVAEAEVLRLVGEGLHGLLRIAALPGLVG